MWVFLLLQLGRQPQKSDSPLVAAQHRIKAQTLILNAGIELMQGNPTSIPLNELITGLPSSWGPEVVIDHGVMIGRKIDPYVTTKKVDNLTVCCDIPPNYLQRDVVGRLKTPCEGVQRVFTGNELNLFLN
ncbi:hypothetical protein P9112_004042 [Eukaryota sp. TZLM1-RC]